MIYELRPKIRTVRLVPYVHEGRASFLVSDPLQLNGHALIIPEALAPLLLVCDGTGSLDRITARLQTDFGLHAEQDDLEAILDAFDQVFLLENERFRTEEAQALEAYREADFRRPVSAGASYPSEPTALHRLLQDLLESVDIEPDTEPVDAVLSPHIDYGRGGLTYAETWKAASNSAAEADLVVIIGTDHYSSHPITLTGQHYATPFGVLPTDSGIVSALAAVLGEEAAFAGELYHRIEHSLELPLVWLHHLAGGREVPIVPILCGSFKQDSPKVAAFIAALQNETAGRNTFTIISGDLAHVGPAFGGLPQTSADRRAIRADDARLMGLLSTGDSSGFLAAVKDTRNATNLCGAYPLYLGLSTFGYRSGKLVGYRQCEADDRGESFVSIGGMTFKKAR